MKEMSVIVGLSVLSFLKVRDPYYFCFYNSGEDDYEKYAEDNEKRDAIAKVVTKLSRQLFLYRLRLMFLFRPKKKSYIQRSFPVFTV